MTYRKALLAGAAYLALGMGTAMAANQSTINQTGSLDQSVVNQVGATSGNANSYILQSGASDHVGTQSPAVTGVTQTGPGAHSSYIDQTGNFASAIVSQSGAAPTAGFASPLNATSDALAESSYGSFILQQGTNDTANVDQSGTGTGRNYSSIKQTLGGNDVEAKVTQINSGASAQSSTIQQGQISGLGNVNGTTIDAEVYQNGSGNGAIISQGFSADHSYAKISQIGTGNFAAIRQYADHNMATINQNGTNNQSDGSSFGKGYGIDQGSPWNIASVTQNGSDFKSYVGQGDNGGGAGSNFATVSQTAVNGSISSVVQNGGSGFASVTQ